MRHKIITTPNDIICLVKHRKCPVCKGPLDVEGIDTIDMEEYIYSTTSCLSTDDHYDIEMEYNDPKVMERIEQRIRLYDDNNNMRYGITQVNMGAKSSTTIMAYNIEMEENIYTMTIPDTVFNLSRFNAKRALQEIKTLVVFS